MMGDQTTRRMGDYEILEVLGSGGMGRVYRVRNVITDRIEAMKVLLPDLQGQEEVAARFLREIKLLAALSHPNIAALHTALTIDNQLVMLMEYVEGRTLSSVLMQGPIPVGNALNYIDQVLSALSYAHQQHVIHRDIKPANMMVMSDGTVKLMDFGIAHTEREPSKLTQTGTTLGSINYMSPEQVRGSDIDERSDIYSVGISLYEMVTGEKPFHGDSNFSIMSAHLQQTPRPPVELRPDLPAGLNEIILTAIAKAPADRFQSADAFRNALASVKGSTKSTATGLRTIPPPAVSATAARAAANAPTWMATAVGTAAAPAPAPEALPLITPPSGQSTGHRGLYMALGGLVVVIGLVAAGIYLPGRGKAANPDASSTSPKVVQQQATPAPPPTTEVAPPSTPSTDAGVTPPAQPAPPAQTEQVASSLKAAAKLPTQMAPKHGTEGDSVAGTNDAAAAENSATPGASNAQVLDEVEHQLDQLYSRAAAVNSSLDHLQQQQAGAGYGLRGDIAGHQASMKVNLAKAQNAIEHNDATRAKRYAQMTEADLEVLEKFLGR
jgi:eukaryotic-like serine/threonine-protein kinase